MSAAAAGLTPAGFRLVLVITGLSVAHHVDHVLRDVTGWPWEGGFNASPSEEGHRSIVLSRPAGPRTGGGVTPPDEA